MEKIELYLKRFLESDLKITDFCKQNELDRKSFLEYLNSNNYYPGLRKSGRSCKNYYLATEDYLNNYYSHTTSAKKFEISPQSLQKYLIEIGVYDKSRLGRRAKSYNEKIFDSIDTEEKAYWLGFIFADGYIYSSPFKTNEGRIDYNFELCSSGEDKEHMQKFANFIGYDKELKLSKADNKGHTRCRICLSSKHLWETLNSYGCTPNKSLTLQFPDKSIFTNDSFILDFIRGYIDGDGWITYLDSDHKKMCWGILGTEDFLKNTSNYLNISYSLQHNHSNENESTMKFVQTGEGGYKTLNKLYKSANIYLQRKYEKYLEYCRLYEKS